MTITFNPKRGRYSDNGKAVSVDELVAVADAEIDAALPPKPPAEGTGDGKAAEWIAAVGVLMTDLFIRLYALGRGGLEQMEDDDWQAVGGMVERQKQYLAGFESDLKAGGVSAAQAVARAALYMAAARGAFESARAVAAERAKKTEERWVITPGENCTGCVANAGLGWVSLGTLPMPGAGATPCRSNCRCHKEYR